MTKTTNFGSSVRELKAAALDALVKDELAKNRATDAAKTARLKALRLARDAAVVGNDTARAVRAAKKR